MRAMVLCEPICLRTFQRRSSAWLIHDHCHIVPRVHVLSEQFWNVYTSEMSLWKIAWIESANNAMWTTWKHLWFWHVIISLPVIKSQNTVVREWKTWLYLLWPIALLSGGVNTIGGLCLGFGLENPIHSSAGASYFLTLLDVCLLELGGWYTT